MRASQSIAVIGGVAAGTAAAAEAKRTDPRANVVLFERGPFISYGACEIPLLVEGAIDAADLVHFTPQAFEDAKGVQVRISTDVVQIEPGKHRLQALDLVTGARWEERFDKFILATGADVSLPPVDGVQAENVFPVRTLAQASDLRSAVSASTQRHIVVVGAGYVGVEIAESLIKLGHRVSILAPGGLLLPGYLDEPLQKRFTEAAAGAGLVVRDERLTRIIVDPANRVQAVETSAGERIGCKVVVLATGVVPSTDLARAAGVRIGKTGGIQVGDSMRTSLSNVWACGDCIEVRRIVDDEPIHAPLSPTAYRTARVAARNAAGNGRTGISRFAGVSPATALKAFDLEVASVGLTLEQAGESGFDALAADIEHWSRVKHYPGAARLAVRYVVERGRGRLLGAQLIGADGAALRANTLVPLIRNRWTVDQIDELDFVYNPPVAPPLDPLYIAARAALRALAK